MTVRELIEYLQTAKNQDAEVSLDLWDGDYTMSRTIATVPEPEWLPGYFRLELTNHD